MPKYIAILEAQDGSKNYRRVAIQAESKEVAREYLENKEGAYALYRLTTDELAQIVGREKALKDGEVLSPGDRSKLALHKQEKPYVLKSINDEKGA